MVINHQNKITQSVKKSMLNNQCQIVKAYPCQYKAPNEIDFSTKNVIHSKFPCTIAEALSLAEPDCWTPPFNNNDFDWWFQNSFIIGKNELASSIIFEGLATFADVWLNDELLFSNDNMFHCHQYDLNQRLNLGENKLVIHFKSVTSYLNIKRKRPKWKTQLVSNQSLRWVRSTLLGQIPGWSPNISCVGVWKPVYLVPTIYPKSLSIKTSLDNSNGIIDFNCMLTTNSKDLKAWLEIDGKLFSLKINPVSSEKNDYHIAGKLTHLDVIPWWPHTHGLPQLYSIKLIYILDDIEHNISLEKIGYKTVILDQTQGQFAISINDTNIFCRGACWTIDNVISLKSNQTSLKDSLLLMKESGANTIRVIGTMIYEHDEFYQLCDELGIMVWQDFMFSNMDYPFEDADFNSSVCIEVQQQINRLSKHPCITIFCGNSEIQQQIAMLGFDSEMQKNSFFEQQLPNLCKKINSNIPYISSSPTGGELSFRANEGLSHYYAVGAYLRPISEVRKHDVKFTSECLGFSNLPIEQTRKLVIKGQTPTMHHPVWKQRVPRDSGTGWDFEDVRDHYLKALYKVDPIKLRSFDLDRYIELSELVSGEVMGKVYSEWRSKHSHCSGGLVWFLKDLWPGAGWGIIDSCGQPKSCYYFLKRAWQPINLNIIDESINGLDIHISNETNQSFSANLEIILLDDNGIQITNQSIAINVVAHTTEKYSVESILGHFCDPNYTYRFGKKSCNIVNAKLMSIEATNEASSLLSEDFFFNDFPIGAQIDSSVTFEVISNPESSKDLFLRISTEKFLYGVNLNIKGYTASDNFFNLIANAPKTIKLTPQMTTVTKIKGYLSAVNLLQEIKLKF